MNHRARELWLEGWCDSLMSKPFKTYEANVAKRLNLDSLGFSFLPKMLCCQHIESLHCKFSNRFIEPAISIPQRTAMMCTAVDTLPRPSRFFTDLSLVILWAIGLSWKRKALRISLFLSWQISSPLFCLLGWIIGCLMQIWYGYGRLNLDTYHLACS